MPFDPNDKLTVEMTAMEWNQIIATYQEGMVRTLAPLVNDATKSAADISRLQSHMQAILTKLTDQLREKDEPQLRGNGALPAPPPVPARPAT